VNSNLNYRFNMFHIYISPIGTIKAFINIFRWHTIICSCLLCCGLCIYL